MDLFFNFGGKNRKKEEQVCAKSNWKKYVPTWCGDDKSNLRGGGGVRVWVGDGSLGDTAMPPVVVRIRMNGYLVRPHSLTYLTICFKWVCICSVQMKVVGVLAVDQ